MFGPKEQWTPRMALAAASFSLRSYEEAQRQRYHLHAVFSSSSALDFMVAVLSRGGAGLERRDAQAAIDAYQAAVAAWKTIKKCMPAVWSLTAEGTTQVGAVALPEVRRFLAAPQSPGQHWEFNQEVMNSLDAMASEAKIDDTCSGCSSPAVGLRKCSRCRQASYCR